MYTTHKDNISGRRPALNFAAGTLWRTPGRFGIARVLDPFYSLRCVVFHDISVSESPFTKGMGIAITPGDFVSALKFLTTYYTPVRLQDVLGNCGGRDLPPRPVLVTFDDGYASTIKWAAPLCNKFGVPAVCFLNAAFIDNQRLAPDNLVCYVANKLGIETINEAVRTVRGADIPKLKSVGEVFSCFFPAISLTERKAFLDALLHLGGIDEVQLAREAGLYLTRKQLHALGSLDFEVGNHTYTHVRCRTLTPETFTQEIDRNKAELETLTGRKVRSFSVPYGSSADLTSDLVKHLKHSGHDAVFLSESVANHQGADRLHLDRVSTRAGGDNTLFFEIEILPRLRAMRNRLFRGLGLVRTGRKAPSGAQLAAVRRENPTRRFERTQQ
ncbi:MAG: polysaccharide deacetylase family protein [Terriglobia bacterium]